MSNEQKKEIVNVKGAQEDRHRDQDQDENENESDQDLLKGEYDFDYIHGNFKNPNPSEAENLRNLGTKDVISTSISNVNKLKEISDDAKTRKISLALAEDDESENETIAESCSVASGGLNSPKMVRSKKSIQKLEKLSSNKVGKFENSTTPELTPKNQFASNSEDLTEFGFGQSKRDVEMLERFKKIAKDTLKVELYFPTEHEDSSALQRYRNYFAFFKPPTLDENGEIKKDLICVECFRDFELGRLTTFRFFSNEGLRFFKSSNMGMYSHLNKSHPTQFQELAIRKSGNGNVKATSKKLIDGRKSQDVMNAKGKKRGRKRKRILDEENDSVDSEEEEESESTDEKASADDFKEKNKNTYNSTVSKTNRKRNGVQSANPTDLLGLEGYATLGRTRRGRAVVSENLKEVVGEIFANKPNSQAEQARANLLLLRLLLKSNISLVDLYRPEFKEFVSYLSSGEVKLPSLPTLKQLHNQVCDFAFEEYKKTLSATRLFYGKLAKETLSHHSIDDKRVPFIGLSIEYEANERVLDFSCEVCSVFFNPETLSCYYRKLGCLKLIGRTEKDRAISFLENIELVLQEHDIHEDEVLHVVSNRVDAVKLAFESESLFKTSNFASSFEEDMNIIFYKSWESTDILKLLDDTLPHSYGENDDVEFNFLRFKSDNDDEQLLAQYYRTSCCRRLKTSVRERIEVLMSAEKSSLAQQIAAVSFPFDSAISFMQKIPHFPRSFILLWCTFIVQFLEHSKQFPVSHLPIDMTFDLDLQKVDLVENTVMMKETKIEDPRVIAFRNRALLMTREYLANLSAADLLATLLDPRTKRFLVSCKDHEIGGCYDKARKLLKEKITELKAAITLMKEESESREENVQGFTDQIDREVEQYLECEVYDLPLNPKLSDFFALFYRENPFDWYKNNKLFGHIEHLAYSTLPFARSSSSSFYVSPEIDTDENESSKEGFLLQNIDVINLRSYGTT